MFQAKAKAREQDIFRQARAEVERRMARLKGGAAHMANFDDDGASAGRGLGGDDSGLDLSVMSALPPKARAFNLKRDAGMP